MKKKSKGSLHLLQNASVDTILKIRDYLSKPQLCKKEAAQIEEQEQSAKRISRLSKEKTTERFQSTFKNSPNRRKNR